MVLLFAKNVLIDLLLICSVQNVPAAEVRPQPQTDIVAARARLMQYGENFREKSGGDTTIHMCDTPAMVYVCAQCHVPINTQNFVSSLCEKSFNIDLLVEKNAKMPNS